MLRIRTLSVEATEQGQRELWSQIGAFAPRNEGPAWDGGAPSLNETFTTWGGCVADGYYAWQLIGGERGLGALNLCKDEVMDAAYVVELSNGSAVNGGPKVVHDGPNGRGAWHALTFTVPTSVTELFEVSLTRRDFGVADDVMAAVNEAAEMTVQWFAIEHSTAVRWHREAPHNEAVHGELVALLDTHQSGHEGQVGLHAHVRMFNLSLRDDGTFSRLHTGPLFRSAAVLDGFFLQALREKLECLGYTSRVQVGGTYPSLHISFELIGEVA